VQNITSLNHYRDATSVNKYDLALLVQLQFEENKGYSH
jgi:hypothetical protein